MNKHFFTFISKFILLLFALCVSYYSLYSQYNSLYNYEDLSHIYYLKQKDSIKKNWTCPDLYKIKERQKKYKEIWDSRTDFITSAFETKDYVYEKELFAYLQTIIDEIVAGNQSLIPTKPTLLLDRSSAANAYAIGGNVLAVNLGLITFARYREDLAMVIAHELGHNILNHAENAMKDKAEWLTSDDYKQSLNSILNSKYERLSRLKKVFESYSFNRNKHQRYKEGDADSLAIELLKNTKIPFNASFFLKLDSSDIQYKQPLSKPFKTYFAKYDVPFEESWLLKKSKGLSTRVYNFKDTTSIEDSLKTHPDCKDRYAKSLKYSSINQIYTPIPTKLKEKANKMLIWNLFDNEALTACLYRILIEKDSGNKDEWYDFMVYNVFFWCYSYSIKSV